MEYYDENIINALHIQRRDTFGSIEEGMYINNELIHFKELCIFQDKIKIVLPENFIPMLPEIMEIKYPAAYRPEEIYTSIDTATNFTFNYIGMFHEERDTRLAIGLMKQLIQNANPAYEFYGIHEDIEKDVIINRFAFKSYGIDDPAYNVMYIARTGKHMIQGTFNCLYSEREEWERAAISVIKTIRGKEGE